MATDPSLMQLEAEVAAARAQLAKNLDMLRAPDTASGFTDALKEEAMSAKDALVDKVSDTARSTLNDFVEDLKAKAAANPVAVLAIGAGIGWKLLRHPPITTALIGVGLYGLFSTPSSRTGSRSTSDYMDEARRNLETRGREAWAVAREQAMQAGETVRDYATQAAFSAADRATEWTEAASLQARDAVGAVRERAGEARAAIAGTARDWAGTSEAAMLYARDDLQHRAEEIAEDTQLRNTLLIGAAGIAVAAAIGLAYQRSSENAEADQDFDT